MESAKRWYVIHTYSGYENRVTANLERKIHSLGMENEVFRIVVPMENEFETGKDGKRKVKKKKKYPGYVLVEMIISDRSWYVVRNTPGVTGFVGSGSKPIPLSETEVMQLFKDMGIEEAKPKLDLYIKQVVRIKDGAFENLTGTVIEIDEDRSRVKVLVAILGRDTRVDLDMSQIEIMD